MPRDNKQMVLFLDGKIGLYEVYSYSGAAFIGDPTAYVKCNGKCVWVSPGQSVSWVEHKNR